MPRLILAVVFTLPFVTITPSYARVPAPFGHHYKVCEANRLSNNCSKYARQREGQPLEMDINGNKYPDAVPARVGRSSPSRPVAQGSNSVHKMCLEARDYQGCVNSFTGRKPSSSNSNYEREMLRLREQELLQQQINAQQQQDRYERERKWRMWNDLQRQLNPPSVNCTTTSSPFGGFSTYCQ